MIFVSCRFLDLVSEEFSIDSQVNMCFHLPWIMKTSMEPTNRSKSKQALFNEVLKAIFEADIRELEELLHQPGTVRKRMATHVKQQWKDLQKFALILPLIRDFYAMMQTDQQLRDLFQNHCELEKSIILELLRQGEERGELVSADAETAAEAFLSLQEGLFLRWTINADSKNMIRQADFAVGAILDCLEV